MQYKTRIGMYVGAALLVLASVSPGCTVNNYYDKKPDAPQAGQQIKPETFQKEPTKPSAEPVKPVYIAPTESQARDAMKAAAERAVNELCIGKTYSKPVFRLESTDKSCPDFKLIVYSDPCRNTKQGEVCADYKNDCDPPLSSCSCYRIKRITEEEARRNCWTQEDLKMEYYRYFMDVLPNWCGTHRRSGC